MKRNDPALLLILAVLTSLMPGLLAGAESPGAEFRLPPYETFRLKNGLTVYLMEHHEVPLIHVSAVFSAGAVKDGDRAGLASLTAKGLLWGTRNHNRKQLEEQLDFLGVSYSSRAGVESAGLTMAFVNSHQDRIFPLLQEIVLYPAFAPEEFAREKKRTKMSLEQAKEVPSRVIRAYYHKFLYGDHPYGNPVSGTPASVGRLEVADLKAFHRANYNPAASALAIVGDFKTAAMKKRIKTLFKSWRSMGKPHTVKIPPSPTFDGPRVLLVNKADAAETQFIIGGPGIRRNNPDYIPVQVVNTVLGGRFTSWLMEKLRTDAGLTYGARSFFNPFKLSGTFGMYSFTNTPDTIAAIDLALGQLERLHRDGIDAETLASAKNYINGQFPPKYETAGQLANLLTSMFVYGFNRDFIDGFRQNVSEITVEKAREIIGRYFPRNRLQFVMIGKAETIGEKVTRYGPVTRKEIKAEGF